MSSPYSSSFSIPLKAYRSLLDSSRPVLPRPRSPPPSSRDFLEAQLLALRHLYNEYEQQHAHQGTGHSTHGQDQDFEDVEPEQRASLIHQLLTIRSPSLPLPPPPILEAIDLLLAAKSSSSPDPLIHPSTLPSLPSSYPPFKVWKGDLTRLSSPSLAVVNPANRAALGCFQPRHLCLDNVLHACAGPRLRKDCFEIMEKLAKEEEWKGGRKGESVELGVSKPIVTKGWSLPAGYVVHVAGPQLERGSKVPTDEEKKLLAESYERSLDLAVEVGSIDTVAFPCISTGIFAFPSSLAAVIALKTVASWISSHPTTPLEVIFVLFSPSDVEHYLTALNSLYPNTSRPLLSLPSDPISLPQTVKDWVRESESIILHSGAGLSADAVKEELGLGLDYTSEELFATLYPALLESTEMRTLYHSIGYKFQDPLVQWAFTLGHGYTVLHWGPTPLYTSLLSLLESKSSFTVKTSNADNLFLTSLPPTSNLSNHLHTPQGSYANFQCLKPCTPTSYFPSLPWILRAQPFIDPLVMRLPSNRPDLIPKCEKCGGPVFYNVRGGNWFLETPQEGQEERYYDQVEEMVGKARKEGKKVLLLEIGSGFNTPGVVRWPGERLVRETEDGVMKMVRVNLGDAQVPMDLSQRGDAVGVRMGAVEFLKALEEGDVE